MNKIKCEYRSIARLEKRNSQKEGQIVARSQEISKKKLNIITI